MMEGIYENILIVMGLLFIVSLFYDKFNTNLLVRQVNVTI